MDFSLLFASFLPCFYAVSSPSSISSFWYTGLMPDDKFLIDDMSMGDLLAGLPERVNSGTVVKARVLGKNADGVLVDIGLKMEGLIPKTEFPDFENQLPFKEGESISVLVRQIEGHDNYHRVSWRAAREMSAWDKLYAAFQGGTP